MIVNISNYIFQTKRRSGGFTRVAAKTSRGDYDYASQKRDRNMRKMLDSFMDPAFDLKSQTHANIDKARWLKETALGELKDEDNFTSVDLERITSREAESLGYPRDRCRLDNAHRAHGNRQPRTKTVLGNPVVVRSLQVYLENDSVSRLSTRTREEREVNGERARIRYLCKPLQPTLLGFIEAHPTLEVSLSSLTTIVKTQLKHIMTAPASNRESCLCLAHDRAVLLHQSLLRCGKFDD